MTEAWKFMIVAALASLSALISAETVVIASQRAAPLRAATAQSEINAADTSAASAASPATIVKSSDGHYWADGQVNGAAVRFLVDTGATAVALTPEDARRLGFTPANLNFASRVVTAAGQTRAASVKLASVTVAGARLDNVDALVIEKGLDTSLLGMTYLGRLASFQATRQTLILQP
ncbi:MAG: TIGR02281 family clan AA aspartic protease [Phenylobacterium sp.]